MVTLDLVKIGKYGFFSSLVIFISAMLGIIFCLPNGESGLVWFVYLGILAVAAKAGITISVIMFLVGLLLERKERQE